MLLEVPSAPDIDVLLRALIIDDLSPHDTGVVGLRPPLYAAHMCQLFGQWHMRGIYLNWYAEDLEVVAERGGIATTDDSRPACVDVQCLRPAAHFPRQAIRCEVIGRVLYKGLPV